MKNVAIALAGTHSKMGDLANWWNRHLLLSRFFQTQLLDPQPFAWPIVRKKTASSKAGTSRFVQTASNKGFVMEMSEQ